MVRRSFTHERRTFPRSGGYSQKFSITVGHPSLFSEDLVYFALPDKQKSDVFTGGRLAQVVRVLA
jgi:hypothetical protein